MKVYIRGSYRASLCSRRLLEMGSFQANIKDIKMERWQAGFGRRRGDREASAH